MRTLILQIVLLAVSLPAAAGLTAIELEVTIDPDSGSIAASADLTIRPAAGTQVVEVLLNRELRVSTLTADIELAGFEHVRMGSGPYRYAPQATALRVNLASPSTGRTIHIAITYDGRVEPDSYGVIQVRPTWVELVAAYSGWIPFDPDGGPFAANWRARLPAGWSVLGTGAPHRDGELWTAAATGLADLVLIAAPEIESRSISSTLSIHHVDLPEGVPDRIADDAERVRDTLTRWFGPPRGVDRVDLVFAPRQAGGGYARPGLVVMLYEGAYDDSGTDPRFMRYLAHEIAHLWWRGAPTTDWQDWLNESFAEFTALMILREDLGDEAFSDIIESYRKSAAAAPPMYGLDRDDEAAYTVLYRKGPVILAELERSIGREAFVRFLRAAANQGVVSTEGCLEILSRVVSPGARNQLDAALRR